MITKAPFIQITLQGRLGTPGSGIYPTQSEQAKLLAAIGDFEIKAAAQMSAVSSSWPDLEVLMLFVWPCEQVSDAPRVRYIKAERVLEASCCIDGSTLGRKRTQDQLNIILAAAFLHFESGFKRYGKDPTALNALRRSFLVSEVEGNFAATDDAISDWELHPSNAHPRAKRLLRAKFYWDTIDEDSPFGNDTGADTLELYRGRFSARRSNAEMIIDSICTDWGVDRKIAENVADDQLQDKLATDHFHILAYDDLIIALAFAQLVFEGMVDDTVRARAKMALIRQGLDQVIEFRGWENPDERRNRCRQMLRDLEAAVGT